MPAPPTPFDAGPGRIWPLVLSKAARTLTTVLLVLGAIGVVAYVVIIPTSVHFSASLSTSVGAVVAADQTQSAYDALQTPTNTFVSGSKSCRATAPSTSGELQCLQSVDSTFATAIQGYQTTLSGISYPSVAQSDADAAIASARQVDTLLQSLATAPDAQTYSSIAASPAFTSSLHSLDSTYNQLMTTLNNA